MSENRFKYLQEYEDNELLSTKEKLEDELERDRQMASDPFTNSEQKSELLNSDIPYEEDLLSAITAEIEARGLDRGR